MMRSSFQAKTRLSSVVLSLVGCCLLLLLAACGQSTATFTANQSTALNTPKHTTMNSMRSRVATAQMPPTQTSCPANGQGRPAVFAPLALGSHQNLVFVYNVPGSASLKRFDISTGTKQRFLAWEMVLQSPRHNSQAMDSSFCLSHSTRIMLNCKWCA